MPRAVSLWAVAACAVAASRSLQQQQAPVLFQGMTQPTSVAHDGGTRVLISLKAGIVLAFETSGAGGYSGTAMYGGTVTSAAASIVIDVRGSAAVWSRDAAPVQRPPTAPYPPPPRRPPPSPALPPSLAADHDERSELRRPWAPRDDIFE